MLSIILWSIKINHGGIETTRIFMSTALGGFSIHVNCFGWIFNVPTSKKQTRTVSPTIITVFFFVILNLVDALKLQNANPCKV